MTEQVVPERLALRVRLLQSVPAQPLAATLLPAAVPVPAQPLAPMHLLNVWQASEPMSPVEPA